MKRLVVFRHAKSEHPDGVADPERPLAKRGRADAGAAGQWLADHVGAIDLVICSPAVRARQTWEAAAAELTPQPPVRYEEEVYAASPDDLLAVTRDLPDNVSVAVLVGHNPAMEDLVGLLSGRAAELKTAAVAVFSWSGGWADAAPGTASLDEIAVPRGGS
jgi:phosphohistidine phosphatase